MQFYQCIKYFYLGQQADDHQKWGERVTYFSSAHDKLQECLKLSKVQAFFLLFRVWMHIVFLYAFYQ